MSKKDFIVPIFVPHKGCTFNCIFCNQNRITGQDKELTSKDIDNIIVNCLETIEESNENVEIAFFGGSFTAIPIEEQNMYLSVANKYLRNGNINAIRLSTRPDYINKDILLNLKKYSVSIVELGVQTMDEEVLKNSGRGHKISDTINAVKLLKEEGFTVGAQLMVGLPGDNKEKCLDTARKIVELKPNISRIYPALVIKDTYMEIMYERGKFIPLKLEDAVDICKEMLIILESNSVNVIRIGLQPTDEIQMGKSIVAGPFHPSFRQLVESEIFKDMLISVLDSYNPDLCFDVYIYFNPLDYSNIIGQKKSNLHFLNNKYPHFKFSFKPDCLEKGSIAIDIDNKLFTIAKEEYYKSLK